MFPNKAREKWFNVINADLEKYGTLLTELNKCDKELRINNYEEGLCQGRQGLMPARLA